MVFCFRVLFKNDFIEVCKNNFWCFVLRGIFGGFFIEKGNGFVLIVKGFMCFRDCKNKYNFGFNNV